MTWIALRLRREGVDECGGRVDERARERAGAGVRVKRSEQGGEGGGPEVGGGGRGEAD